MAKTALELKVAELEAEAAKLRAAADEDRKRPRCGTCRYFHIDGEDFTKEIGECRRYAPRALVVAEDAKPKSVDPIFPTMFESEWCGEWNPDGWSTVEREAYRARNADDPGFSQ